MRVSLSEQIALKRKNRLREFISINDRSLFLL